jgi:uncharacterized protein involved in exopolysaccharide biosynthesis
MRENLLYVGGIIKRRWFVIFVTILIGIAAGVLGLKMLPQYEASSGVLLITPDANHDTGVSSADMPSVLISSSVAGVVRRSIAPHTAANDFASRIASQVAVGGNMLTITFKAKERNDAVRGANALADRMTAYYREVAKGRLGDVDGYLLKRLGEEQTHLTEIDRQLRTAASRNPYVGQTEPVNALTSNLVQLESQRGVVEAAMRGDMARTSYDTQQLRVLQPTVKHELLQNDAAYRTLESQVANDGAKLATMKAEYLPSYSGTRNMQRQYDQEVAALRLREAAIGRSQAGGSPTYLSTLAVKNQAASSLAGERAQLAAIDGQIARTLQSLRSLPHSGVTIATLTSERTAAEAAYQAISVRRTTILADQAQAASIGSLVVVDRAQRADAALGKHAALILVAAVAVFTVIAFTLAFLLESLDQRLRTEDAISQLYGKPIIGSVGVR